MTFVLDNHINNLEATQTSGSILVRNNGGYVSRFSVSFKLDGKDITVGSGEFTCGVNKSVAIPAAATDIYLKVEEAWFINSWSTIFTKNYSAPLTKSFEIGGTTLNPTWKEI
ncbi:MAG: hypothetical protein LBC74_10585 [Planctomycetaceae bacterium]|jgi:hypothetical protein|nr:hypothetical protein [Planctomycetaceae bacterium]